MSIKPVSRTEIHFHSAPVGGIINGLRRIMTLNTNNKYEIYENILYKILYKIIAQRVESMVLNISDCGLYKWFKENYDIGYSNFDNYLTKNDDLWVSALYKWKWENSYQGMEDFFKIQFQKLITNDIINKVVNLNKVDAGLLEFTRKLDDETKKMWKVIKEKPFGCVIVTGWDKNGRKKEFDAYVMNVGSIEIEYYCKKYIEEIDLGKLKSKISPS